MEPAPAIVGGSEVICYTPIDERHRFTGKTRQIVAGRLMGAMAGLAICRYPADAGFYLFGCDVEWSVVTDTYHDTVEDAKEQAEWEYVGSKFTWVRLA